MVRSTPGFYPALHWKFSPGQSGFPSGSAVKNLPAVQKMQEMWVQSLGQEDPLEEEMATHSSNLAWEVPWAEEPGVAKNQARLKQLNRNRPQGSQGRELNKKHSIEKEEIKLYLQMT